MKSFLTRVHKSLRDLSSPGVGTSVTPRRPHSDKTWTPNIICLQTDISVFFL